MLLSGEPGIGKSRLVEALKETSSTKGHAVWSCAVRRMTQNSALAPVIEHLQRVLQFQREDTPEEKLQQARAEATQRCRSLQDRGHSAVGRFVLASRILKGIPRSP